jgi:uncharacterized membrane protein (DUF373 family)
MTNGYKRSRANAGQRLATDTPARIEKSIAALVGYLVILLAVVMLLGLAIAVYKVAADLVPIVTAQSFDSGSRNFVVDTLSTFVILELLLGFLQYQGATRIPPTYILDAGLFFVTRQLMIELYSGNISAIDLVAFGAVIGALGFTRIMLTKSPTEQVPGVQTKLSLLGWP